MSEAAEICPIADGFRFMGAGPVPTSFERYDELQDQHRMWRVEEPAGNYWMCLDRELIVQGLQNPEVFSSSAIVVLDPDPAICMKPIQLDPPQHTKWRKMLASYFSVKRMPYLEGRIRQRVTELLDEYLPKGECDFVQDIAMWFPSVIFLEIVGLPVDELPTFLEWERDSVHAEGSDREAQFSVMLQVMERFQRAINERRANPDPAATDIISHAVSWEIDGEPVSDGDVLECCLLLFLAGLDTVTNELSYAMWHLATHPEDQATLREEPGLIAKAVEELLRVFSIPQLARKVTRDVTFGGQELKAGEMVLFSLSAANRDVRYIDRARQVVIERDAVPHYAFGAGPHRCLGSHLARQELKIFLEEWCHRVADYGLATDGPITEHHGAVHGLSTLPLRWTTEATELLVATPE